MKRLSVTTAISFAVAFFLIGTIAAIAQERRAGAISVSCERFDAEVYLDGIARGCAPVVITSVSAGNHQLVVLAPGVEVFTRDVKVEPGVTTQVHVRLVALSGSVSVTTDPPGATVMIDGRNVGISPVDVERVAQGEHILSVSKRGYTSRDKEIDLEYGDVLSVFLRMKEKETTFSVFSFPSGAGVFLDEKKVGITPLTLKDVAPGTYSLRVANNEGCSHEEIVTVKAGKELALDITLPVAGAVLSLDSGPAGRKLFLDGRLFTTLKGAKAVVPFGQHLLKITGWKETLLYQRRINLQKGKSVAISLEPKFSLKGQLKGHEQALLSMAFAPDAPILASASKDGTVRIWDMELQKELLSINAHPAGVQSVAFHPEGRIIVSGGWDRAVRVWDATAGEKLKEFELASPVQAVAWSPNGHYVTAGCADGTLRMWAVEEGWKETVLPGHEDGVRSLAFGSGGAVLISAGADGRVFFWRASDCSQTEKLTVSSPVKSIAISADGEFLAIGCEDGRVRIRAIEKADSIRVMRVQPHWVLSLASAWGCVFAAGGDAEKVTIVDSVAGRIAQLDDLKSPANALAFGNEGRYFVAGTSGGVIYFWIAE